MKFLTVVGARPQFIKWAPVSLAIEDYNRTAEMPIESVLLHTGQHYDGQMSRIFFDQLKLNEPNYNLGVGSGPHGLQSARMISRIETVLLREQPDLIVLYGDTNSTLAGAIAAAKLQIPVAHVEAGLRSFNRRMPEELNRIVTDHLASIFFAPTPTAVENLRHEGIHDGVHLVGDVMFDALIRYLPSALATSTILKNLAVQPKNYCLVTVHRAENTDDPERLHEICAALERASLDSIFIWPVHPRCRKRLDEIGMNGGSASIRLIDPVSYLDMLALEKNAKAIITDSGGVQKEAHWVQVPCVTLRTETEWIETLDCGCNHLAGNTSSEMTEAILEATSRRACGNRLPSDKGAAAEIVRILAESHIKTCDRRLTAAI